MSTENVSDILDREALSAAIIELNTMSPCDGVILTRDNTIKVGYETDEDFLCMLIPAPVLARRLTADGLSSYGGKELKAWADKYDIAPLLEIISSAKLGV